MHSVVIINRNSTANRYGGELGGSAARITIEFAGPATGYAFTDRAKSRLISRGWSVVSVSHVSGENYIAVLNGNSSDNLGTVARNFEAALSGLSAGGIRNVIAAFGTPGVPFGPKPDESPVSDVSPFNFTWNGVLGRLNSPSGFKDEHDIFNRLFTAAFPKLRYTAPTSSANTPSWLGFAAGSQLFALGETRMSESATRAKVLDLAKQAGFHGDERSIVFTQGDNLRPPGSTVNPLFTSDGSPFKDLSKDLKELADGWKIPVSLLAVGGIMVAIVILKK